MSLDGDLDREQDIEELRRLAKAIQAQNQLLLQTLASKSREIDQLKGQTGDLQLTLKMLESLQAQANAVNAKLARAQANANSKCTKPKARGGSGPTPQPNLPIVERLFELDDPDRVCPNCGKALRPMAGQYDESEMIDVVEVRYELVKVKQQKYACNCGRCIETALGPDRALTSSRYSLAFAIKVVLDKWLDHLPLERQCRILERHGLVVTSQTLWDLANALAHRLKVLDDALLTHVLAQPVIGLDQTGWPRLDGSEARPWQMWCLTAPGVVVHRIRDDKSAATFVELVGAYHGTIVCDALATHAAGARDGPGIELAGCWAHVHRKFAEAASDHPDAEKALAWIAALYEVDARADLDVSLRGELRKREAPAILDAMRPWLYERAANTNISIGKAAAYALANWQRLVRFVEDPAIPLDNNATERAIRGPVVGRKNHYGSKSRRGTEVAATLYTILETAKLHDLNPAEYLRAALAAADNGIALLPWQYTSGLR